MALLFKNESNWDQVKKELKKIETMGHHHVVGEIENTAYFAESLQNKQGYFVFDDKMLMGIMRKHFRKKRRGTLNQKRLEAMAEAIILEYVEKLRSHKGTAPPFRKKFGPRPAHPGGWADITGYLNNSYRYRINKGPWKADPKWQAGLARSQAKFAQLFPNSKRRR